DVTQESVARQIGIVPQETYLFHDTIRANLPWNADRDSVVQEVTNRISDELGREDFYITQKYWLLSDDWERMTMRLNVFCNEDLYDNYDYDDVITRWRNHFSEQSFVQIVVIGMSKKEYFERMRGYN
ncbi:MAG: hypothetical protein AAF570_17645, partial [Bacteroidota bacterium]